MSDPQSDRPPPGSQAFRDPPWFGRVTRAVDLLAALLLAAMVVMVFGNVVLRYAFDSGIAVSEELSRWAFVWMTFLGAVVALKEHAHLGSDMLVSRLGRTGKRVCMVLSLLLMLWMTWLIFQGSLAQTRINVDVEAPVTGWPMAIVYAAGLAFAVPAAAILLRELWRAVTGRIRERDLVMTQESEDLAHLGDEVEGLAHVQQHAQASGRDARRPGAPK